MSADDFADSMFEAIKALQRDLPENMKLRFYGQGKDGVDFRVGHIQISPAGLAILSGKDTSGNSVYAVSHFQRMHFVCEISELKANEPKEERKQIGFSR